MAGSTYLRGGATLLIELLAGESRSVDSKTADD
jgi:hypothetical protein